MSAATEVGSDQISSVSDLVHFVVDYLADDLNAAAQRWENSPARIEVVVHHWTEDEDAEPPAPESFSAGVWFNDGEVMVDEPDA